MGLTKEQFYDESQIAIIPMGFCYPGKGKSGDLPPRNECAELYFERLLKQLQNIELTMLIGQYAQAHFLRTRRKRTLTETVRNYQEYAPGFFTTPHPSPRNTFWLQKNPWFEKEVLFDLRKIVLEILA